MFSRPIVLLLKYFEFCGFQPEYQNYTKKKDLIVFICHIISALFNTCVLIDYGFFQKNIIIIHPVRSFNHLFPLSSVLFAYWIIIIESYAQRGKLRKFWILQQDLDGRFDGKKSMKLSFFMFQFIEYLIATSILCFILCPFFLVKTYTKLIWIVQILLTRMCQNRAFYYTFHLNLLKYQLKNIENEIKTPVWRSNEKFIMKFQQNYEIICQMVDCINSAFCWSHFATILSLFHVALADINWTYTHMYDDQSGFTNCNSSFRNHYSNEFKFFTFSDVVLWIFHLILIIYYIFQSGIKSQSLVGIQKHNIFIILSVSQISFVYFRFNGLFST